MKQLAPGISQPEKEVEEKKGEEKEEKEKEEKKEDVVSPSANFCLIRMEGFFSFFLLYFIINIIIIILKNLWYLNFY